MTGCSGSEVPQVITFKWEVITALNKASLFHGIITIFQHIPRALQCIPSWCEFKNLFAVDIRFWHLQPFTNISFHFLIIVTSVASKLLRQRPKQLGCRTRRPEQITILVHSIHYMSFAFLTVVRVSVTFDHKQGWKLQ